MSTATTKVRPTTEDDITAEVLRRFDGTEDPRLKQIMQSLVKHVHAFLKEVQLLSDTLGVSMLTDLTSKPAGSTESTVFGPFHRADAPERQFGDSIVGVDRNGTITYVSGRVELIDGRIQGAQDAG